MGSLGMSAVLSVHPERQRGWFTNVSARLLAGSCGAVLQVFG